MCMIAWRPVSDGKGANIPNAVIDTAMTRHPDGFGVAWRADGELHTERFGPKERKAFRRALKRVDREGNEYVAHFRYATHGPKEQSHAHPFEYTHPEDGRVLVFHNGIIDIATTPKESDTEVFVRDVLAALPSKWWDSPALRFLVNEAIGYSKLVIMTGDETVSLHDGRGDWDSGIWYSSSHKPTGKSTWTPAGKATNTVGGRAVCEHKRGYLEACVDCDRSEYVSANTYVVDHRDKATSATALVPVTAVDEVVKVFEHPSQFRHAGHNLTAVCDISMLVDADYEDAVLCDECGTTGTVFVIDGMYWIDMAHLNADDAEDDLLPGKVIATERR